MSALYELSFILIVYLYILFHVYTCYVYLYSIIKIANIHLIIIYECDFNIVFHQQIKMRSQKQSACLFECFHHLYTPPHYALMLFCLHSPPIHPPQSLHIQKHIHIYNYFRCGLNFTIIIICLFISAICIGTKARNLCGRVGV